MESSLGFEWQPYKLGFTPCLSPAVHNSRRTIVLSFGGSRCRHFSDSRVVLQVKHEKNDPSIPRKDRGRDMEGR